MPTACAVPRNALTVSTWWRQPTSIPTKSREVCRSVWRAIVLNPKYLFCDEPNSGLDPQTSLVIDHLLSDITHEYGITTIINTPDMNSVMGIGENIIFIYKGTKEWQGVSADIMGSTNERLTDFIFASDLLKKMKRTEMQG